MATEPGWNYFNYFTEVEDHFQRARGTGLFLLSPIDWALIETWKDTGVPLEAVLRGIDVAMEKWRSKKRKYQQVNSVAYCAQAVHEEAKIMAGGAPARKPVEAPFTLDELRAYMQKNIATLSALSRYDDITMGLENLLQEIETHYEDLEQLEQRLTALEDKMSAIATAALSDEQLFEARRDLDSTLRPYRSKMTADQIAMLERQFLERRVLETSGLPRLSLFYLTPE